MIVAEYVCNGIPVRIDDGAFRDLTPEQVERNKANARAVAWQIIHRAYAEGRLDAVEVPVEEL